MGKDYRTIGYKLVYEKGRGSMEDVVKKAISAHQGNIEYSKKDGLGRDEIKIKEKYVYTADAGIVRSKEYEAEGSQVVSEFDSKPSVEELVSAITSATGKKPSTSLRQLSQPDNSRKLERLEDENTELKRENQRLKQAMSEMKSDMEEMRQMMKQMQQEQQRSENNSDSSATDDRIDDIFDEAGLDDPEL